MKLEILEIFDSDVIAYGVGFIGLSLALRVIAHFWSNNSCVRILVYLVLILELIFVCLLIGRLHHSKKFNEAEIRNTIETRFTCAEEKIVDMQDYICELYFEIKALKENSEYYESHQMMIDYAERRLGGIDHVYQSDAILIKLDNIKLAYKLVSDSRSKSKLRDLQWREANYELVLDLINRFIDDIDLDKNSILTIHNIISGR